MVPTVFVVVLGIVLTAYFLFVVRDENKLLDRLKPRTARSKALRGVVKPEERMSSLGPIQSALEHIEAAIKAPGPISNAEFRPAR